MKLGIVGLNGSGKTTIFKALTGNGNNEVQRNKQQMAVVTVPDERIDYLSRVYNPRKTTYAKIEYLLPGAENGGKDGEKKESVLNQVRNCDALIHIIRNFNGNGSGAPAPLDDFRKFDGELIFSDFSMVEKRLERIEWEKKRGKSINPQELAILNSCRESLEEETPLRRYPEIASAPVLSGFAMVSAKPQMVLFNNRDADVDMPQIPELLANECCLAVSGMIESELSGIDPEDSLEFMEEFGISESAMYRVIRRSYEMLGLISFFTVGEDEVRAWTIPGGIEAVDAAEVIHSDIKKGFIRAEVLAYNDFVEAGGFPEARKRGKVRLEGKNYKVQDGDIISFRFNV